MCLLTRARYKLTPSKIREARAVPFYIFSVSLSLPDRENYFDASHICIIREFRIVRSALSRSYLRTRTRFVSSDNVRFVLIFVRATEILLFFFSIFTGPPRATCSRVKVISALELIIQHEGTYKKGGRKGREGEKLRCSA